jgi:hypothetical protein
MAPLDERPQIGTIPVEPGSLNTDGVELSDLLAELGVELPQPRPADTPPRGWRVLSTEYGGVMVLGTPAGDDRRMWRVGQVQRGYSDPAKRTFSVHPTPQLHRPSNKDRAGGLLLRWPDVTRSAPDVDLLAIDIVNTGAARWHPQGDSFVVIAELRLPGAPAGSSKYAFVGGQNPALPLDPGEYARVRVTIDASQWERAKAGRYEVHPTLVGLGLRSAEPVHVELTEQIIRDHLPRRPPPLPPPAPVPHPGG